MKEDITTVIHQHDAPHQSGTAVNKDRKKKKAYVVNEELGQLQDQIANFDLIDDQFINLSTDNKFSFKINKKLKVDQLNIESQLNFDELYTKSNYQDFIFLKNGNILITYKQKELKIDLNSNFLFKNEKYNNNE